MPVSSPESSDLAIARISAEAAIRVGLLLVLVYWCFTIAEPFLVPIVWGMIIAVAVHTGYDRLRHRLRTVSGTIITTSSRMVTIQAATPPRPPSRCRSRS